MHIQRSYYEGTQEKEGKNLLELDPGLERE
jgi:hypothetical protein